MCLVENFNWFPHQLLAVIGAANTQSPSELITSYVRVYVTFEESIFSPYYRDSSNILNKDMNDSSTQLKITEWKTDNELLIVITSGEKLSIYDFFWIFLGFNFTDA